MYVENVERWSKDSGAVKTATGTFMSFKALRKTVPATVNYILADFQKQIIECCVSPDFLAVRSNKFFNGFSFNGAIVDAFWRLFEIAEIPKLFTEYVVVVNCMYKK